MKTDSIAPAKSQRIISCALKEIRDLNVEIMTAARTSVKKAIRIGELLIKVKSELPHGDFIPWVKENLKHSFSLTTAERWMRLFEKRNDPKIVNLTNLSDTYRLLAPPPDSAPVIDVESKVVSDAERPPSTPADAWEIIAIAEHIFTREKRSCNFQDVANLFEKLLAGGTWLTDGELEAA